MAKLTFNTKAELFKHLKDNKDALIAEKKFNVKKADSINYHVPVASKDDASKSINDILNNVDLETIKAEVVINTTNILDSHGDVHIPGIWKKSLSEKKSLYLLQEHQMKFDSIITDKTTALTKSISWKDLGFPNFKGNTEALIFNCEIDSDRNKYMFEQYLKGYVKNHSVGMRYVNLFMCINSEEKYYREEKDNWDKYIYQVANSQDAIDNGYFWAVTEAKIIEGSAVVMGSNYVTPTMSVTQTTNVEADNITSGKSEPSKDTQEQKQKTKKENLIKFLNN